MRRLLERIEIAPSITSPRGPGTEAAPSPCPARLFGGESQMISGRKRRLGRQFGLGLLVLGRELGDEFAGAQHVFDRADALAAAPDVAPGLGLLVAARAEVHGRRI